MSDPLEDYRNVPRPSTPGPWHFTDDNLPPRVWSAHGVLARGPLADDMRAIAALPDILEKLDRLVRAVKASRDVHRVSFPKQLDRIDAILRGEE